MSFVKKDGYLFDPDRQVYIFSLPCMPKEPFVVDKADIDSLCAAYSKHGENATKHECAVELGWDEIVVEQVLKAMNFRHANLPFSEEDLSDKEEEELAQSMLRLKERKVKRKAQARHWQKVKDDAAKWAAREENMRKLFRELNQVQPQLPVVPKMATSYNRLAIATHATDLHYGKHSWQTETGKAQSRETTRQSLLSSTNTFIGLAQNFGTPEVLYVGVGGDMFHIDNPHGTTTSGTPQDHDGTYFQIYSEMCQLTLEQISLYRFFARRIVVVPVPGNHDRDSSKHLAFWLQAAYQGCDDVEVLNPFAPRQFCSWDNNYMMWTHGDNMNYSRMRMLMATEHPELWAACEHKHIFTGHLHSQAQDEDFGVTIERFSSLASADSWHKRKGYVGNAKALQGLVLSPEGTLAKLTARPHD